MFPWKIDRSDLGQKKHANNWDLEISEIPNIDEIDRIYMASPRGLSGGKTEPPDYILMFSSANVRGITYKINFEDFLSSIFEKKKRLELRQAL